jgi:hypothetical protein
MTVYVLRCERCGFEESHSGPVWEDWFVPRVCERPAAGAEGGMCGGTLIRLPPDDPSQPAP